MSVEEKMETCKFGGSCTTNTENLVQIKNILKNKNKKIIIFSAIGKIKQENKKTTDFLFEFYEEKSIFKKMIIFNKIKEIFIFLRNKTGSKINLNYYLNKIKNSQKKEYIVSRGEDLTARMMSEFLNLKYIPAEKILMFKNGVVDERLTGKNLNKFLSKFGRICTGGFYGMDVDTRQIVLLERGGGDVSGAIFAKLSKSKIYENYTNVSGVKMANPKYVVGAKTIPRISYDNMQIICEADGEVLHKDVCKILRYTNVKTIVKNIVDPNGGQTHVDNKKHKSEFVCCSFKDKNVKFVVKKEKSLKLAYVKSEEVKETYEKLYKELVGEK